MCLAGLFHTAQVLVQDYDLDAVRFQEVEEITLSLRVSGWDKEFILRLTKTEPEGQEAIAGVAAVAEQGA